MKFAPLVLLVVSGCGSVSGKEVDARLPDTQSSDTAVDVPGVLPPAAVAAYGNATFAAAGGTFTKIVYQTEEYDDRNEYDPSTGRFTPLQAGDYLVCASIYIPNTLLEIDMFKNNARYRAFGVATGVATGCQPVRLAVGDYIEIWVGPNTTATVGASANGEGTWLTISQITTSVGATAAGTTNVPTSTFVKVPNTAEAFDTSGEYDDQASTFHPAQAGDYQFCSWLAWNSFTFGGELDLYVNNTRENGMGSQVVACGGCRTLRLAANDAVDVRMWQGTGGQVAVPAEPIWDWLAISKLPALMSVETMASSLNVPSQTFVKVPYATELFDDSGRFDVGTNTFTAAAAGDYLFCASANGNAAGGANNEIDLFKNGARDRALGWSTSAPTGCRVLRLAASDQIDVRIWHDKTTAATYASDPYWYWFQASKIR